MINIGPNSNLDWFDQIIEILFVEFQVWMIISLVFISVMINIIIDYIIDYFQNRNKEKKEIREEIQKEIEENEKKIRKLKMRLSVLDTRQKLVDKSKVKK